MHDVTSQLCVRQRSAVVQIPKVKEECEACLYWLGVDGDQMTNKVPGLYFIGEVVDVTGWLGGYNFQWAWSSGWSAGQVA